MGRQYTGSDTTTYGHDLNGNRTNKDDGSEVTTYIFDVANRLVEAKVDNVAIFSAAYDARTRRLAKTEDGSTTIFRYDGGTNFQELREENGSLTIQKELIRAGGLGGGIGSILYSDKSMAATPGQEVFGARWWTLELRLFGVGLLRTSVNCVI